MGLRLFAELFGLAVSNIRAAERATRRRRYTTRLYKLGLPWVGVAEVEQWRCDAKRLSSWDAECRAYLKRHDDSAFFLR
jgi:hypothetical protein